jgi:hypothetical protein
MTMTPQSTNQQLQQSAKTARRISPECSEVLHMLSSLDAKSIPECKPAKG